MKMIELYTTGPAKRTSIESRDACESALPADMTILDMNRRWTYDVNQSPSKSRNSPFHGVEFRGGAVATIVNGQFVWRSE